MTRESRKQRNETRINKDIYNNFTPLQDEIECSYCNNFGHEEYEFAAEKFSQKSIYLKIPRYGERMTYRLKGVA